jgi:hypothetical protein
VRLDHAVLMVAEFGDQLKGAWPLPDFMEQLFTRGAGRVYLNYLAIDAHPIGLCVRDRFSALREFENVDLTFLNRRLRYLVLICSHKMILPSVR